jgi:hypothetical protein
MAQSGLEAVGLRWGRFVRVGDPMDGMLGAAQRSRNRENNEAAKNKYGGECNNVCMFECPNQKGIHADK